ncbi:hypothetical protein HKD37_19G053628 [Glycine soja]
MLKPARSNPIVLLLSPSALSSSLSQTGLHFCDCNHIVEFVCVKFVSATYRLRSKKTTKGKGGKRFWKSIVVGFKPPREAIEDPSTKQIALLSFLFLQGSSIHHISISELWSTAHHFLALIATSIFQRKCAFARKCARLVKEQRARFYIMRHCVIMLICWHDPSLFTLYEILPVGHEVFLGVNKCT